MRQVLWLGLGALLVSSLGLFLALRPPRLEVAAPGVVLTDVTVVNPGEAPRPHQSLFVTGDRIERIAPTRPEEPRGAESGGFVLPGLVDLHVHHPPSWALGERELFALLFLAHGVTAVRDVGEVLSPLAPHQLRIARGRLAGPRVYRCGPVLDGEPPTWPGSRVVRDVQQARDAVSDLAGDGVDCIKLYNRLSSDQVKAILGEAAARGLPVVAHVPVDGSLAALAGAEVQHLMGLTRDWQRLTPERIGWYVERSRESGIAHAPTLEVFERHARIGTEPAREDPGSDLLPRHYSELLWSPERNPIAFWLSPSGGSTIPARPGAMREVVRALYEAGVSLRVGSDAGNLFMTPGASLHDELRQLVAAGLSPEVVWSMATRGAAEALGHPEHGRLREGAQADLVVFRSDPTVDLAALEDLELVVSQGRAYTRAELDAALDAWRQHAERWASRMAGRVMARALLAASPAQR